MKKYKIFQYLVLVELLAAAGYIIWKGINQI